MSIQPRLNRTSDAAVIAPFDNQLHAWRAARLPVHTVKAAARFSEDVHGHLVAATDGLLGRGEVGTDRLRKMAI
jgi:hypothetical protein